MKRITLVARVWMLLSLVVLGLLLCSGCQDQSGATIRYGGQYYPGEFLLKGHPQFWEEYGLAVEHILFSSGTENNQALISGEIDVNVGSDSKTVALFGAIPDRALIIATIQRGDRYSTIVRAGSPYESWHDLKGKTVGTRLGTGAEQVLLRYFDQTEDLSWDDFEWVNLKIEDMIAALADGSIEAFTGWEPTPAIAEAQGIGRALRSYGDIALVPVSVHTTKEYATGHRDEIVNFLAAHTDKVDMIQNDPDRAAQLAAQAAAEQGIDVSADAFKRIFERVDFSLEFDDDALASIQDTAEFLHEQGNIDAVPKFSWDTSFLEEAKELRARE
ncbi:MAG: ABC transporter substrate-binding protein [Anaerolineae bacterium]|jgi:NitT/TauT family transport system substrate-binding protein